MIIKDHTEHGKLADGQLVTGADGKLWLATKHRFNTAPGRPESPEETWLERWSDEYSVAITDAGPDEYGGADDVVFPLTTVRVVPDLDDNEARFLAMHAHYEAQRQLDARSYACVGDDGTIKLNEHWATRQERHDRWEAISRALYPGEIWPGGSR